jgi:hypothetical protein
MPIFITPASRYGPYDEALPRFEDVRELITTPGVRLVLPSEETRDDIGRLGYVREFERTRDSSTRTESPDHKGGMTSFGRVYINAAAEPYMKEEPLRFPVGSMIVREMLWKASDTEPHLVSVMVKRERGFNPILNDWEFAVVDRSFSRLKRGDSVISCAQCHAKVRSSDFLFKTYLTGK